MVLRFGHRTHVGRRANNEDSLCAAPELGLFVVADGMGGYEGGEVASRIAVTTVREQLLAAERLDGVELGRAVSSAHCSVREARSGRLAAMGSTLDALLLAGGRVAVAHVGDSRVYRLRGGVLAQLTRDHSLYCELQAQGVDVPPRAETSFAHVITRALGMEGDIRPDLYCDEARAGDVYLLCTDGLTETVPPERIHAILVSAATPEAAADHLVELAYTSGARDNITVLVVLVAADDEPRYSSSASAGTIP